MSKILYCIRHGLAEHNINYQKYGVSTFYDSKYVDTSLILLGFCLLDIPGLISDNMVDTLDLFLIIRLDTLGYSILFFFG